MGLCIRSAYRFLVPPVRALFLARIRTCRFVYLEPWVDGPVTALAATRDAQLIGLTLPNTHLASMHDAGDPSGNPDGSIQ